MAFRTYQQSQGARCRYRQSLTVDTILLEVAQMERSIIRNRMAMGYQDYLNKRKQDKENHPLGRPTKYKKSDNSYREQYQKELTLLKKGVSLRNVSKLTGTSIGTLRKIKIYI